MKTSPPLHLYALVALWPDGVWRIHTSSFDAAKLAHAERALKEAQQIGTPLPAAVVSYKFERAKEVKRDASNGS